MKMFGKESALGRAHCHINEIRGVHPALSRRVVFAFTI